MEPSTPATGFNLAISQGDLASMPSSTALALAEHLLASSRSEDAMSVLMQARIELKSTAQDGYDAPIKLSHEFESATLMAARAAPDGVQRLMEAMNARPHTPQISVLFAGGASHAVGPKHHSRSGPALDKAFKQAGARAAQDLVSLAPDWACLHWFNGQDPRSEEGFALALSGQFPPKLLDAYLERDGFCQRLAQQQAYGGRLDSTHGFATIAGQAFMDFDPEKDAERSEPLLALLGKVIQAGKAKPSPNPATGSPLPHKWAAHLALGGFQAGRELAFSELGRVAMIDWARQEGSAVHDSRNAFKKGSLEAITNCAACFGPDEILLAHQTQLQHSAVAMMAKSMDSESFGEALDLFIRMGRQGTLEQSCAHRFWAVYEQGSSVRKMGDALAYCAAEGLIEHAEGLIKRMPILERKDVKDVLAYMNKRDAKKKGTSHSAWEALLIREAMKASPAASSRPRSRL